VLGAVVLTIAARLIDLRALSVVRRESPGEFVLAVTTAAVVVFVGVEQGILLAMSLSLFRIVHHSNRPHTAVLARIVAEIRKTLSAPETQWRRGRDSLTAI